jgi:thiol-disulfide isomerase/thioredoxin
LLALAAGPWTARGMGAPVAPTAGFTLPTSSGTVALDALRGKVVLVDFWASWCVPCRRSFPWMSALADRYAASGLVVVAINLDKSRDLAEEFLRDLAPSFIVAFDPAGKTAEAYHVTAMPSSYLVGRDGSLVYALAGFDPRDEGKLESKIKEAVER